MYQKIAKQIEELSNNINPIFLKIVEIINRLNEVYCSYKEVFPLMEEVVNFYRNLAESYNAFIEETQKKIEELSIKAFEEGIDQYTLSFNELIKTLNIISINVGIEAIKVNSKTIYVLSKELNNFSENIRKVCEKICKDLYRIYEKFKEILEKIQENKVKLPNFSEFSPLEISGSIADIITFAQFHDILKQEFDQLINIKNFKSSNYIYDLGILCNYLENVPHHLERIKSIVLDKLSNLKKILNTFEEEIKQSLKIIGEKLNLFNLLETQFSEFFLTLKKNLSKFKEYLSTITMDHIFQLEKDLKYQILYLSIIKFLLKIEVERLKTNHLNAVVELIDKVSEFNLNFNFIYQCFDMLKKSKIQIRKVEIEIENIRKVKFSKSRNKLEDKIDLINSKLSKTEEEISSYLPIILDLISEVQDRILGDFEKIILKCEKLYQNMKFKFSESKDFEDFKAGYEKLKFRQIMAKEEDLSSVELF